MLSIKPILPQIKSSIKLLVTPLEILLYSLNLKNFTSFYKFQKQKKPSSNLKKGDLIRWNNDIFKLVKMDYFIVEDKLTPVWKAISIVNPKAYIYFDDNKKYAIIEKNSPLYILFGDNSND
jgi:hypothetical protein